MNSSTAHFPENQDKLVITAAPYAPNGCLDFPKTLRSH
jgi:hypothetical protein